MALNVPNGSTTVTVTGYSALGGAGGTGQPLETQSLPVTIAANTTNKLAFALGGIVASAKLAATPPFCIVPIGTIVPVMLQAFDAAGQIIVGSEPYVDTMGNPLSFTLVDTDASTNTHVVAGPRITTPQGAASIQYTGGIANPMLSASIAGGSVGGGVTPRSFTINCTESYGGFFERGGLLVTVSADALAAVD